MTALSQLPDMTSEQTYRAIAQAIEYLSMPGPEASDIAGLAHALSMSERQLVDMFRRWCGLTPKSFAQAVALDHARKLLRDNMSVLDTTYELGLSGPSRLHDLFVTYDAVPPGVYRAKGAGLEVTWGYAPSPFGNVCLMVTQYGVAGISFADDGKEQYAFEDLAGRWPNAQYKRDDKAIAPIASRIFDPGRWDPDQPIRLVMIGSQFEIKVWETLLKVPAGRAATYGEVARAVGRPNAARAIGRAVGRNPISFVVPCHRIVGSTGALTGYHWGIVRKRAILGWEAGLVSAQ
ncbi:methylated-DNA--[protein]-cysteine S-methyltransferase [Pelagibacterium halotolerans]|nr:methylated-DNA--[protein]-cysteine S-methyltransferase [Pelagibacterium halotolerans]QJR20414.1 methylated-DNA--[protein]-cysteine S-methyltransferase [Pelagibacterium halotolerans]SEA62551.1 AraC family transcriptional regulator, regulatory protein of adaptative response / methylated-DNA-[protein]-cysteine methyltransferase [Pelagibacterium halotolerans]